MSEENDRKGRRYYLDKKRGLKPGVKIKKCLKCDKEFVSLNDMRLCENCKKVNGHIESWRRR